MATSSVAVRQLSDGNQTGTVMGISTTDLISFYGVTSNASGVPGPQAQVSIIGSTLTAQSGVVTTAAVSTGGANNITVWSFNNSSQPAMVISTMTALWKMGLIG